MPTASLSASLSYTPPGATAQVVAALANNATYDAQSIGTIDIPDGTGAASAFAVPFGSIGVGAKLLIIKNRNNADVGVRLQGAVADEFQLPAQGFIMISMPVNAGANPVLSASITTTAIQSGNGYVDFFVYGS